MLCDGFFQPHRDRDVILLESNLPHRTHLPLYKPQSLQRNTKKKAKKSTLVFLMRNFGLKLPRFGRSAGAKLGLYEIAEALRLGRK